MTNEMTPADIAAVTRNNNGGNGGWAGDWSAWIIIFLIFGMFGWGGMGGFGGFGGGRGAVEGYTLTSDFANIERKIDGVNQGLCDGFYAQNTNTLNGFANLQNNVNQGFAGINQSMVTQGYENRIAINGVGQQLASCCCDIKGAIADNSLQNERNTNVLSRQLSDCCCENEKIAMQNRFDMQTYNCNTLQAIDKLGDRIVDYMANIENQRVRDELQSYKLAASQATQNNYLISQLRPCPVPSYNVPNPYCGCGCNNC